MNNVVNTGALLAAAAVGTVAFIPMTYIIRPSNQMPVRGIWLLVLTGIVAALCILGWSMAWRSGFEPRSVRLAIAATVPAVQWAALLAGSYVFQTVLGRLPDGFSLGGTAQRNADVLMHAFVVFVLMLGSLGITEVCLHR
jgi:hypothetical protein